MNHFAASYLALHRFRSDASYFAAPFVLGTAVDSGGVSHVVKSDIPHLAVGDLVETFVPWQEQVAMPAEVASNLIKVNNPHNFPPQYFIGAMVRCCQGFNVGT